MQVSFISTVLNQDRQNYREAIQYINNEINGGTSDFVFSIGFGGEHFKHYAQAKNISIARTESVDELLKQMYDKKRIWCLITAWLPDARPHYEDPRLYSEDPRQVEIYRHLKNSFRLKKYFNSKLPVEIYFLER